MENTFIDCEQKIGDNDFLLVEQDLGVKFPADFKIHYKKYNGGTPHNTIWVDPDEKWDENEVGDFLPIRFAQTHGDDENFTLDGVTRLEWEEGKFPRNLIPFATDWGFNFFCVDHTTGEIYFYIKDEWNENLTIEKNFQANTRYITDSLHSFINGLVFNGQ